MPLRFSGMNSPITSTMSEESFTLSIISCEIFKTTYLGLNLHQCYQGNPESALQLTCL